MPEEGSEKLDTYQHDYHERKFFVLAKTNLGPVKISGLEIFIS
jgi:hypothetical protein